MRGLLSPLWLVVAVLLVCGGADALFAQTFAATAQIQLVQRSLVHLGTQPSTVINDKEMANEIEVMESPDVLSPIITNLKLDTTWGKRFGAASGSLGMQAAIDHLRQITKITRTSGTNVVSITVTSEDSGAAAETANAIADQYKAMRDNAEKQLAQMGERVLRDQITQQQKIVADTSATAAKDPQDAEAQNKATEMKALLDALKMKLQQEQDSEKTPSSPVLILSRASAAMT